MHPCLPQSQPCHGRRGEPCTVQGVGGGGWGGVGRSAPEAAALHRAAPPQPRSHFYVPAMHNNAVNSHCTGHASLFTFDMSATATSQGGSRAAAQSGAGNDAAQGAALSFLLRAASSDRQPQAPVQADEYGEGALQAASGAQGIAGKPGGDSVGEPLQVLQCPTDVRNAPNEHERAFKVHGYLSSGTFGQVYAAHAVHTGDPVKAGTQLALHTPCAIKVEQAGAATPSGHPVPQQLTIESHAYALLSGVPQVPTPYGAVCTPRFNALVLPAMHYTWAHVAQHCPGGVLSEAGAALFLHSTLEALEAAHAMGVLHRDIKPQNTMLHMDKCDVVQLVDWGMAGAWGSCAPDARDKQWCTSQWTPFKERDADARLGTSEFMSPFVHHGKRPCRRDDVVAAAYAAMHLCSARALPWVTPPAHCPHNTTECHEWMAQQKRRSVAGVPLCLQAVAAQGNAYSATDCPDYDALRRMLVHMLPGGQAAMRQASLQWAGMPEPAWCSPEAQMAPEPTGWNGPLAHGCIVRPYSGSAHLVQGAQIAGGMWGDAVAH